MMSEIVYSPPQQPTRRAIIDEYMGGLTPDEVQEARAIQTQITHHNTPLARHQVLIPVAAHQEAAQIPRALQQYAHQTTRQPFSIILGLNSPSAEQSNPAVTDSLHAIDQAVQRYPQLDIRTALSFYDQPRIGTIRRNLWHAALMASMNEGAYTDSADEVIGINHDIDTVSMSPRYMQRVQTHYQKLQQLYSTLGVQAPLLVRASTVKHAYSPEHPIISHGAYWTDFSTRSAGGWYEAGIISPMSHYALSGGFTAQAITHETRPLVADIDTDHTIPGTAMQTSLRRYIDRLQHGFDAIWTNDSFGDSDPCRDGAARPDMTLEQLEAVMLKDNHLSQAIANMAHHAINNFITNNLDHFELSTKTPAALTRELTPVFSQLTRQKISLAADVMARVLQSPRLTRHASDLSTDKTYCAEVIAPHF